MRESEVMSACFMPRYFLSSSVPSSLRSLIMRPSWVAATRRLPSGENLIY